MKAITKKTPAPAEVKYPRRDARKRQTRENVLAAARKLFEERGYDEVKMAEIAAAADVHITTMFIHFGSKRELADALGDAEIETLQRLIGEAEGKIPFFTFFRGLVTRWARSVISGEKDGAPFSKDIRSDPELAFSWLGHHWREVGLYANYFASDYGMDVQKDLLPSLVATMLTGGNVIAHERWAQSGGRSNLLKDALAAIDLCQQMVEAVHGRPGEGPPSHQTS